MAVDFPLPHAMRLPLNQSAEDRAALTAGFGADLERARKRARLERQSGPSSSRANVPRPSVYDASDFAVSGKSENDVELLLQRFPVLTKRNFYVVQNHFATAKHHDLRLHLDGETISFAIPRGLSGLEGSNVNRQAFETDPHPLNYTLFEGHALGTTAVWDIGTYKIVPTRAEVRKRKAAAAHSSDEESEIDEPDWPDDVRQEELFCKKYHYAAFLDTPARLGRPIIKAPTDNGRFRAFIVELHGKRYKGLRLRFFRHSSDRAPNYKHVAPGVGQGMRRTWLLTNDDPDKDNVEDLSIGDRSVVSGLTMQEIAELNIQYGA